MTKEQAVNMVKNILTDIRQINKDYPSWGQRKLRDEYQKPLNEMIGTIVKDYNLDIIAIMDDMEFAKI